MAPPPADSPPPPDEQSIALGRTVGVGCFSLFVGAWSGGIIGVLIGKMVEGLRRSAACEGLPTCNWYLYAAVGALIGAVSLPILVINRLKRGKKTPLPNARG